VAITIGIICVIAKRALIFAIRKLIHRHRTQPMALCSQCSSPSVEGDLFCRQCGLPLVPTGSQVAPAVNSPKDARPPVAQRLRDLASLRTEGLVSADEYETKKAEILANV
jgi:hypothetical protein